VLEVGEIYFISGRPVYAALGSLRGREALRALTSWARCRFAFDPDVPPPVPNVSASVPAVGAPPDPERPARRDFGSSSPGGPGYAIPHGNDQRGGNGAGFGMGNGQSTSPNGYSQPTGGFAQSGFYNFNNTAPRPELQRHPRRAPDVRDLMSVITTYNLSRGHRTLLLLANGEHTILDLVRISAKPVEEVMQLLAELERYGLIYYY
jgi:hypothetical protein